MKKILIALLAVIALYSCYTRRKEMQGSRKMFFVQNDPQRKEYANGKVYWIIKWAMVSDTNVVLTEYSRVYDVRKGDVVYMLFPR